jgi:hypothetical protein
MVHTRYGERENPENQNGFPGEISHALWSRATGIVAYSEIQAAATFGRKDEAIDLPIGNRMATLSDKITGFCCPAFA